MKGGEWWEGDYLYNDSKHNDNNIDLQQWALIS